MRTIRQPIMRYKLKPVSYAALEYSPFVSSNNYLEQDDGTDPPTISRSGQPIHYALSADKPNIGHGAPPLTDVATGRKSKLRITKVTSRKKKKSPGQSSAAASSQMDDLANPLSPPLEGKVLNSLVISFHLNIEYTFVL